MVHQKLRSFVIRKDERPELLRIGIQWGLKACSYHSWSEGSIVHNSCSFRIAELYLILFLRFHGLCWCNTMDKTILEWRTFFWKKAVLSGSDVKTIELKGVIETAIHNIFTYAGGDWEILLMDGMVFLKRGVHWTDTQWSRKFPWKVFPRSIIRIFPSFRSNSK